MAGKELPLARSKLALAGRGVDALAPEVFAARAGEDEARLESRMYCIAGSDLA
jgi:hypothetical protein